MNSANVIASSDALCTKIKLQLKVHSWISIVRIFLWLLKCKIYTFIVLFDDYSLRWLLQVTLHQTQTEVCKILSKFVIANPKRNKKNGWLEKW